MGCRFIALNGGKYFKAEWGAEINAGDFVMSGGRMYSVQGVLDTVNTAVVAKFLHSMDMCEEEVDAVYVKLDKDWRPTTP